MTIKKPYSFIIYIALAICTFLPHFAFAQTVSVEPKRIVFAGGMIAAGDVLLDRINYYFKKHIWGVKDENVKICFATLGDDAGIFGAAALARDSKKADDGS